MDGRAAGSQSEGRFGKSRQHTRGSHDLQESAPAYRLILHLLCSLSVLSAGVAIPVLQSWLCGCWCRRRLPVDDVIDRLVGPDIPETMQLIRAIEDHRPGPDALPLAVLQCFHGALLD